MIHVTYEVASTAWTARKLLNYLERYPILSFDTETKGVYTVEEREEAKEILKAKYSNDIRKMAALIAANSGLSYPSLVDVTHFVFGTAEDHSKIIVADGPKMELLVWNWIARQQEILFAIHNTVFDLKLMKHRINRMPNNYEDTQLMAKCLTNHCDAWRAKVGLKDLMGTHYAPAWSLLDEYEPKDPKDPNFLLYAATDGAATIKLYNMCLEMMLHE